MGDIETYLKDANEKMLAALDQVVDTEAGLASVKQRAADREHGRREALTEAYWKLRDHASGLRDTTVYRKASERKEGTLRESPAFQRYRWLEATARGIEDGAHDIAELLGVPEHEIERPADIKEEETGD